MGYMDKDKLLKSLLPKNIVPGDIVIGKVVAFKKNNVYIDVNLKSEGSLSISEFEEDISEGDEVKVLLENIEDHKGKVVISRKGVIMQEFWQDLREKYRSSSSLVGSIIRRSNKGYIVDIGDRE